MATKTYTSEVMASIHDMMEGLYDIGAIDKKTMREFDDACLAATPVPNPEAIKATHRACKSLQNLP